MTGNGSAILYFSQNDQNLSHEPDAWKGRGRLENTVG